MKLALYGYGGHAREVAAQLNQPVEFFVDDIYANDIAKPISTFNPDEYQIMVAVGPVQDRYNMVKKLPDSTVYFSYIHPSALLLADDIVIGAGSFIGAGCVLTTNIRLGEHTILNRGVHIGHDCMIGNYFSAMPGSIISGNVSVGDLVYIGSNSSIKEKTSICSYTTIGMAAAVINNINIPGTYVGVPAILKK